MSSRYSTEASQSSNQSRPQSRSFWTLAAGSIALAAAAYTLGSIYPPQLLTLLYPRPAPPLAPALSDPDSEESKQFSEALERVLQSSSFVQKVRTDPVTRDWLEFRPYTNAAKAGTFTPGARSNHLTAGSLKGPGKLAIEPLGLLRPDNQEAWFIIHLGQRLCGHEGIIHGGLVATMLDEALAFIALCALPEKVGVTANLSVNFKKPTRAQQFVVIKTQLEKAEGRKAWVTGRVEDFEGNVLVESSGLFVQPKYAALLNRRVVHQAMGLKNGVPEPKPLYVQPDGAGAVGAKV